MNANAWPNAGLLAEDARRDELMRLGLSHVQRGIALETSARMLGVTPETLRILLAQLDQARTRHAAREAMRRRGANAGGGFA